MSEPSAIPDSAILALADNFCRNVPYDDQDDCRQELCIALLRARERFNPALGNWLHYSRVTAIRAIQDFWRNHPTWDRVNHRTTGDVSYDVRPVEQAVFDEYGGLELVDCLCDLRRKDQKILLYLIAGYSANEISNSLNISIGYIPNLLRRLRVKNSEPFSMQPKVTQHQKLAA